MPTPSPAALAAARIALQHLLESPPEDWDGLLRAVELLDRDAGRVALMEQLRAGDIQEGHHAVFMALAEIFGLEIPPEFQKELVRDSQNAFMASMLESPDAPFHLAETMAQQTGPQSLDALRHLDEDRRPFLVPAWLIFGPALTFEELTPLHPFIVETITAEAVRADLDIWDELLALQPVESARKLLMQALMQHRTSFATNPTPAEPLDAPVRAFFSECDGSGAFTLLLEAVLPGGQVNVMNAVLGLAGDLRDGFILAGREPGAMEEMMEAYLSVEGIAFTRIPVAEAAALARRNLRLSCDERDARTAAATLIWAAGMGRTRGDEPRARTLDDPVAAVPEPTGHQLAGLFMDTHLSWFQDRNQLEILGVDTTALLTGDGAALDAAFELFDSEEVHEDLKSLLRHMSLFRRYAGTEGGALPAPAFYDRLAAMLDEPEERRTLLRHYFTSSMAALLADPEGPDVPFGDAPRRECLRQVGFPRLTRPKGKHMAYLDFAEVAHTALESIAQKSREEYLAEDAYAHLAVAVGKAFVDAFFEQGEGGLLARDPRRFKRLLNAMDRHGGLDADRAEDLWNWLAEALEDFQDRVCDRCVVDCLARPTGNLEEWFWAEEHPGRI